MSDDVILFEELRKGDEVFLKHLNRRGVLLEAPQGKKKVRVACNSVSLLVGVEDIGDGSRTTPQRGKPHISVSVDRGCRIMQECPTYDLHRLTLDEAIESLGKFLDSALLNGVPTLRVIHGHGTGRLKKGIRAYLKESPYVASFYPAPQHQGGDGVVIIEMKG